MSVKLLMHKLLLLCCAVLYVLVIAQPECLVYSLVLLNSIVIFLGFLPTSSCKSYTEHWIALICPLTGQQITL